MSRGFAAGFKVGRRQRTRKDMVGRRFGRLVVVGPAESVTGTARWRCRCDCGAECIFNGGWLRNEQRRFDRGERKAELCCPECSPRASWIRARRAAE